MVDSHDPLCPVAIMTKNTAGQATVVTFGSGTCKCVLIAEVRADTIDKAASVVEAIRGYDMSAAWYSEIGDDYAEGWVECVEAAVAKINSLRGKP